MSRQEADERVFFMPEGMEEAIEGYFEECKTFFPSIPGREIDIIDRAMIELDKAGYDTQVGLQAMKRLQWSDLGVSEWSEEDVSRFEAAVVKYGHDLEFIKREVIFE